MRIIMVGVGGSGMMGLAFLLKEQGHEIFGVDDDLVGRKRTQLDFVNWLPGARPEKLEAERLVYSDAVPPENLWRRAADAQKIRQLPYHEAVAEVAKDFEVIAVAGTHGKTTTCFMLAQILIEAGLEPTVLLGASVPEWQGRGARVGREVGGNKLFVLEADEFRDHFLAYHPQGVVVTSIDFDHPDYFRSLVDVRESFDNFLRGITPGGWVVTHEEIQAANQDIDWPGQTILASALARDDAISYPGRHMRANAALAIAAAEQLGVKREVARRALANLPPLGRRMERLGKLGQLTILSDYGHHPAEIAATMQGAREMFSDQRILVVLEIHTQERLQKFYREYLRELQKADGVILVPVFLPAGRQASSNKAEIDLQRLERALKAKGKLVWRLGWEKLRNELGALAGDFEIALAFTAGMLDEKLREIVKPV